MSAGRSSPSSTRRPTAATDRAAHHPAGAQPDRGPPLHRRAAPPAGRARRRPSTPGRGLPASTATASPTFLPGVEGRRRPHRADLRRLDDAGVDRADLYLAWDFTVASERNLAGACCTSATTLSPRSAAARPRSRSTGSRTTSTAASLRRVTGTFGAELPHRHRRPRGRATTCGPDGLPGPQRRLHRAVHLQHPALGAPTAGPGTARSCTATGCSGATTRSTAFGVLRQRGQLHASAPPTWIGMSSDDIGNVVPILQDISDIPDARRPDPAGHPQLPVPGPADEGPGGFARRPRSRPAPARPSSDRRRRSTTATARAASSAARSPRCRPEWTRAVLGVPGMNYTTLLNRSVDFDPYSAIVNAGVPRRARPAVAAPLIQMLWDRGEANGYAAAPDRRPAAGHARAPGAAARGVRRPPGRRTSPPRSRPAPSAPRPCSPRWRRAAARRRAVVGHPAGPVRPYAARRS